MLMTSKQFPLALAVVAALALPAHAVITRLYPLAEVIVDADGIVATTVQSRDVKNQTVRLKRTIDLKGKVLSPQISVQLRGGDEASQVAALAQRLAPGRSVVLFTKGKQFALGFVEGTWFRLQQPPRPEAKLWKFVHLERYLRRTFHGTSAELTKVVEEVLAGKGTAPAPDRDGKPGYGN